MKEKEHKVQEEKKEREIHDKLLLRGLYFLLIANLLGMADRFESLPNAVILVCLISGIGFNIASVITLILSLKMKKELKNNMDEQ